ncbi:hypothetical protein [uncultured Bacteroides sp.]|uniref:hypothetical protein n=1 Tax=uncultured Bacteroides sp. TaxID=162156 RepID=UPI0025F20BAB|nr:hypothetical protein [uncultured Bacteroides sp.]
MKHTKEKTLLKKMIRGFLSEKEEMELLSLPPVEERMRNQLEYADDVTVQDKTDSKKIWRNICNEMESRRYVCVQERFYKTYSMVASFALLLSISGMLYFALSVHKDKVANIVYSGSRGVDTFSLPDGTMVQMGPLSRLTYPKTFTGKSRDVTLEG